MTKPITGTFLSAPSHFSHFGLRSSDGPGNTFPIFPCRVPFDSAMRISALGLPLASSIFFHKPIGEVLSVNAPEVTSAAARISARAPDPFKWCILIVSKGILLSCYRVESKQEPVTISRPMAGARLRTPRSTDAADEAEDRFSRYGRGRPYCRRQSCPPAGERGSRPPGSSRSRRRSAHSRRGYPAASVLLPCFARVRTWHDMPLQRRRLTESP